MKKIKAHSQLAKRLMASALALTICAPYIADGSLNFANSMKAYAGFFGDTGGATSSSSGFSDSEKGVGDINLGYRFYIYDADKKEIARKADGTQCIVDVGPTAWSAQQVHNTTRLGKADSDTPTIKSYSDYAIFNTSDFTDITNGYHGTSTFSVKGDEFYNWMTTATVKNPNTGETLLDNRCEVIKQLFGFDVFLKCAYDNYYLIVEPTIRAHVLNASGSEWNFANSATYGSMYDTWESWFNNLADYNCNGGALCHIKADIGNGFYLKEDYSDTLGIAPKGGDINWDTKARRSRIKGKGYGMGVYYCTVDPKDSKGVINSYNIDSNPTSPDKSEQPSSSDESKTVTIQNHTVELQNSGEKNVIKIYMDAYVDKQASGLTTNQSGNSLNDSFGTAKKYTAVVQTGIFGTTQTTDKVVIQDEYSESGYHVV